MKHQRKITNKSGLPDAVVNAIMNDDYDRGDCDYTVTELLSPPRVRALREKYKDEIEVDAEDLITAFEGKILHKILEGANRTGLVEKRFFAKIKVGKKTFTISAQIDSLAWDDEEHGVLTDWKRCPTFKLGKVEPDWESQLNVQAWILRQNGIEATGLQVIGFGKDHSKTQAFIKKNYPKKAIVKTPIPLLDEEKVIAFLIERITLHEAAKKELPDCTDNERYKRFHRDFGRVVPIKCLIYCDVSKWCDQYKGENNEIQRPTKK